MPCMTNADESKGFSNAVDAQIERAQGLTDLLNEVLIELIVTDDDGEDDDSAEDPRPALDVRDVLDALASLGLKLVPDEEGESSLAYLRELRRPASDAAPFN